MGTSLAVFAGASGFVGTRLVADFAARGYRIARIDTEAVLHR